MALSDPAHADRYDFITQLDNMGVSYESMLDMIDVGKALCRDLRSDAAGGARQAAGDGIRAGRGGNRPRLSREQHVLSATA